MFVLSLWGSTCSFMPVRWPACGFIVPAWRLACVSKKKKGSRFCSVLCLCGGNFVSLISKKKKKNQKETKKERQKEKKTSASM